MTNQPEDRIARLVAEAIIRPPMVWSPYDGRETRCYTPRPAPGDPERPFGMVRKIGEHRYQQLTGHDDLLTHRGRLVDAVGGLILNYRISCYWQPDIEPEAQSCLLCAERNLNHPEFDRWRDPIQCQVIRDHTVDSPLRLAENPMYRTLDTAIIADVQAMLDSQNLGWQ